MSALLPDSCRKGFNFQTEVTGFSVCEDKGGQSRQHCKIPSTMNYPTTLQSCTAIKAFEGHTFMVSWVCSALQRTGPGQHCSFWLFSSCRTVKAMLQLLLPYLAALVSSQRGSGSRCGSFALWVAGKSLLIFPEDLEANRAEGLKEGLLFPGADQASAEIVKKKSLPAAAGTCYSQMSMSAEASFPEGPKWMRMNLP